MGKFSVFIKLCFQGNSPHAVSVVHLLSDKHTQSLVLKSPIYDVHASFPVSNAGFFSDIFGTDGIGGGGVQFWEK